MPISKEEIELIKKGFQILESDYGIEPLEDEIDEDLEYVNFPFPREEAEIEVETDNLLVYLNEIVSLKIHDYNKVTTDTITQRVITASELGPIFGRVLNQLSRFGRRGIEGAGVEIVALDVGADHVVVNGLIL